MHYRRMDPQPEWLDIAQPRQYSVHDGEPYFTSHEGLWMAVVYGGEMQECNSPDDMRGANPWRDRDGTWYWRV